MGGAFKHDRGEPRGVRGERLPKPEELRPIPEAKPEKPDVRGVHGERVPEESELTKLDAE